ncbi:MFS general substrate transporter [Hypoxylon sp. FL1857]|nr:MFS general substrate transporter [Hypoxylon sp. FL1857]
MSDPTDSDDEITVATERTPLIGVPDFSETSETSETSEIPPLTRKDGHSRSPTVVSISSANISLSTPQKPIAVIGLFLLVVFTASAADAFKQIPMTRIFEDILCHEYYGKAPGSDGPIDEKLCKADAIQSKLAYLFAVLEALNAGISCLVALLWAIVADRIGRKPVYAASSVGLVLSTLLTIIVAWFSNVLPPKLLWVSSLAHLCGGSPVMNACIYSILSDVVPESSRSIYFMRIHMVSLIGNLVSPALSSAMMYLTGPWPAMILALILWIIATAMIAFIPETFHRTHPSNDADSEPATFKARALRGLGQLKDSLSIIRIRSVALILCICLLTYPILVCTLQFMAQFISKRYHIPLNKTGYVQSVYGVAHMVVVLLIVPAVSFLIVQPTTPKWLRVADDGSRDIILVRWSYVASIIGTVILGISPSLPIFIGGLIVMSFGSGSASFIKGIAASYVDAEHWLRLFAIMSLLEITSNIYAMPALAGLFTLGMRLGGEWIGLPYVGVSLTCLAMLVLSLFLQVPATKSSDEESSSERESLIDHNE